MTTVDIGQFTGFAQKFDEGTDVHIKHPVTGDETGIIIRVASYRSERVQAVQRKLTNSNLVARNKNPKRVMTVEEIEEQTVRMAAAAVLSWNITSGEEIIECTPEAARKLLSNRDLYFVVEQLDKAADDDALFIKPNAKG